MDALEQFTVLSGIRIQVLAQAIACKTAFARDLHKRLAQQLAFISGTLRLEVAIQARFRDEDDVFGWESPDEIHLIDSLYVDHGTNEYQINGKNWYSFDENGAPIASPATSEQTEGLDRFIEELAQYGIFVTANYLFIPCDEQIAA